MKSNIYQAFNEIQTRTNFKENQKLIFKYFETERVEEFTEIIEKVVLIIIKHHDKNSQALNNIKTAFKNLVRTMLKADKLNLKTKHFLNRIVLFLSRHSRKSTYKSFSLFFLKIFTIPLEENREDVFESSTKIIFERFIIDCLNSKISSLHLSCIKLSHFLTSSKVSHPFKNRRNFRETSRTARKFDSKHQKGNHKAFRI